MTAPSPEDEVAIMVNGEVARVPAGQPLAELLRGLAVDRGRVVVEHNRCVLRGGQLDSAVLAAGDEVEIVRLVGGG